MKTFEERGQELAALMRDYAELLVRPDVVEGDSYGAEIETQVARELLSDAIRNEGPEIFAVIMAMFVTLAAESNAGRERISDLELQVADLRLGQGKPC